MKLSLSCELSNGITYPTFLNEIEDKLWDYFENKNYGPSIRTIYSGFICVAKDYEQIIVKRKPKLLRKEPALEFEYKLDFETYKSITDEERRKYIAVEYFNNLKEVLATKKLKDFDNATFLQDLETFFKSEGLL